MYARGIKRSMVLVVAWLSAIGTWAQYDEWAAEQTEPLKPLEQVEYRVETQGSFSHGVTPLWLNANKHGLSSLESNNGYVRGSVIRPLRADDDRRWGLGYGLDVAVPVNYTSSLVIQQAFVEGRWLKGVLTIGAKEQPMEQKNDSLSSGAQTLGKNARPVPQVRLALNDYWAIPGTKGWLHLKGYMAFGKMTDDNWQHDFTGRQTKYADGVLYHSKAGYLKLGNEERFCPWSLEVGLEMASLFGGKGYTNLVTGEMMEVSGGTGLRSFWNAFWPGGAESVETTYQNVEGDQLGSWVARLNYDSDWWSFGLYADKFFEDHSSMLQLDYDGYGVGDEWQVQKERKYLVYDFKDWMLGMEYNYKPDSWLNTIVVEYLYTKYQSGPIYHDHTITVADHIGGKDNYYNHSIYAGYQHWGQVMGNPLYRSPLYNSTGETDILDNRFMALHLGLAGHPSAQFNYRVMGTVQEGLGTYDRPYNKKHHNASVMAEATYRPQSIRHRWIDGTSVTLGYGMDFGSILGGINYGFQLTVAKQGVFGKSNK